VSNDRVWPDRREGDERAYALEYRLARIERRFEKQDAQVKRFRELVDKWEPFLDHLSVQEQVRRGVDQAIHESDELGWSQKKNWIAVATVGCVAMTTILAVLVFLGVHA
jgi:hypothetical protein